MCTCGCENKALKDFDPSTEEKYFVCSDCDCPNSIYFNRDDVFNEAPSEYVDSFNSYGVKISSYKLVGGEYTEDF